MEKVIREAVSGLAADLWVSHQLKLERRLM
jgi:hypothetical protein